MIAYLANEHWPAEKGNLGKFTNGPLSIFGGSEFHDAGEHKRENARGGIVYLPTTLGDRRGRDEYFGEENLSSY